ncbi:PAS domain-containing sensor histidine kinase [Rhizobium sp. 32-5/1]|uniref:sensor histidine kinase n=1 Tax=Rhizobium sp. 32-5/1 TaxID=3019602 RepID=UPI00240E87B4|nr:PAS domain-containing sensor histidine kinase [Rhizobium sp. 32-5/1]WEZ84062.1 PAS domain-containing sensor histidine kinase [Rhizobium sp. 32-5/1]
MHYERFGKVAAQAISWICVAIASAVLAAWLTRSIALVQIVPTLFAMQFNTSLCFIATGLAFHLAVANTRRPTLAIVLSAAAACIPLASLIQQIFVVDLGIDRLLYDPFVTVGVDHAGRMVPNAAICFILVSAAIIMTAVRGRNSLARVLCGLIVFVIASSALLGYVIGVESSHNWRPLAQMSPQTAFCFSLLAGGLVFIGAREREYPRSTIAAMLAVVTYLLLLLFAYMEMPHQNALAENLQDDGSNPRSTLLGIVLLSGALYAGMFAFSFRSSQLYRDVAGRLQESEKRLAAIIETAVDGFITIDARGKVLAVNPACEKIFGYRADEILQQNVSMLMPTPYHEAHNQYLENYRITGRAKIIGIGREVEGRRKDGSTFPLDLSVAKVELDHQVIYSGIVRDISERKKYEKDILEANAELEEFSYRTSHDLRSPIASSLGLVGIARDMIDTGDTQDLKQVLGRIETSFRKLDHLIQNIISLTRTKAMEEAESRIPIAQTVRETLERLHYMENAERLRVDIAIDDELTTMRRASRFQIIIDNLLSNAIKYQDPVQTRPEIRIGATVNSGNLVLTVADNGLGIEPGTEHHLFQMFKRLHPQHSFGSGLGLYILKKSVEQLGGTVAYNRLQAGSLFTVTLPEKNHHAH